ncbi:hypothetical protein CAP36_03600 [Chitinophagaceae bacterium IBVUCB2]|nr:hypothetical protein CAP36_03600 [Chitinophagaceae bacterium IBVUCB2]
MDINTNAIAVDNLSIPLFIEKGIEVSVLRLDKIHPLISGNKWFKLRYYLEDAKEQNKKTIVTFGGAWSNHILATAASCKLSGLNSIGIIRGEESSNLSPALLQAKAEGMQFFFISREDYHFKTIPAELNNDENYFINEGGYGRNGAAGAATILDYCKKEAYDKICCACGTGTMIAGLINSATPHQEIIGISVLKNNHELDKKIRTLLNTDTASFQLIHDYHFGGYAKYKPELIDFMNKFYQQTAIPSDFVYTGKLFFSIHQLAKDNFFMPGSKLLLIHSGGLTGNYSLKNGMLIF